MPTNVNKNNLWEFIRYAFVGGVCAVLDIGANFAFKTLLFDKTALAPDVSVAICVALGFIVGLTANYLLSSLFVFTGEKQKQQSRSVKAFLIYGAVGVIGFILTEVLVWLGVKLVGDAGLLYILVNGFVKGIVLIWNYLGRKIFVYHGE